MQLFGSMIVHIFSKINLDFVVLIKEKNNKIIIMSIHSINSVNFESNYLKSN